MNIDQRNNILSKIKKIKDFDLDKAIQKAFPDSENIVKERIGDYSTLDFKQIFHRAINQLEEELKTAAYIHLPHVLQHASNHGNVNPSTTIDRMLDSLSSGNLPTVAQQLNTMVAYQRALGFWNRSTSNADSLDASALKRTKDEIGLLKASLEHQIEEVKQIKKEINGTRKQLIDFSNSKEKELQEIVDKLKTVQEEGKTINELLQQSQQDKGKIEEIVSTQHKLLDDLRKRTKEEQKVFSAFSIQSEELRQKLEGAVSTSAEKFKLFEEHYAFIKSKQTEIEQLTGMAADGALGNRFFSRQESLEGNIKLWRWGVLVAIAVAGGWVFVVFDIIATTAFSEWVNLIINVIKTLPAFVLAGFVIRQYIKERNLQEEYAYRSAVAMTITAYSEMLKEADADNNASRQKMLLDAVQRVYTSPRIHRPSEDKFFALSTRDLREAVRDLAATVKELKDEVLLKK